MLEIDGAHGEGGGQMVRMAVALAAASARGVVLHDVRAKRDKPGLAPQHLAAVRAVAALCDAQVEGLELRSTALRFVPGALRGGEFRVDVGTAGSITLVLQALLPAMVAARRPFSVTVTGGTDVRQAPPIDYFAHVLAPLLARMGIGCEAQVLRRGYYPRGGGEVRLALHAAAVHPLVLDTPAPSIAIDGVVHVANLPEHIAVRMREAALERLAGATAREAQIATVVLGPEAAVGTGGAIVVWARARDRVLGAGRVAERGVRAETLGAAVGEELAADLAAGASVDLHAADQLLVYMALAGGGAYLARAVTSHARTAMWLIEQFLPVRFAVVAHGPLVRVSVEPGRSGTA